MEEVMAKWLMKKLYPDLRHKSDALVEGRVGGPPLGEGRAGGPPFSRNTSSPKMTGMEEHVLTTSSRLL